MKTAKSPGAKRRGGSLLAPLLDLIYPPRCPLCGALSEEGLPCDACAVALVPLTPEEPLPGLPGCYDLLIGACLYEGVARSAVLRYKKLALRQGEAFLAARLAVAVRRAGRTAELVTAAPGSTRETKRRGYDAGARLAAAFANLLGLPFVPCFAPKAGGPQKERDRAARAAAAAELRLLPGVSERVSGRSVLLIDDVVTTGATMTACAGLLRTAGADTVTAAAFALHPQMVGESSPSPDPAQLPEGDL